MAMRRAILLVLPLAACAPELPPEHVAARRAEALLNATRGGNASILAPIAGLDADGKVGVCGLIETPAGPVRVVADLSAATLRTGKPAAQGGQREDIGEGRFCTDAARARWDQQKKADPVGLMARVSG